MERLQFEYPSITFQPSSRECEHWFDSGEIAKGKDN